MPGYRKDKPPWNQRVRAVVVPRQCCDAAGICRRLAELPEPLIEVMTDYDASELDCFFCQARSADAGTDHAADCLWLLARQREMIRVALDGPLTPPRPELDPTKVSAEDVFVEGVHAAALKAVAAQRDKAESRAAALEGALRALVGAAHEWEGEPLLDGPLENARALLAESTPKEPR